MGGNYDLSIENIVDPPAGVLCAPAGGSTIVRIGAGGRFTHSFVSLHCGLGYITPPRRGFLDSGLNPE